MIIETITKQKKDILYNARLEIDFNVNLELIRYTVYYLDFTMIYKKVSFTTFKKACQFYKKIVDKINKL